MAIQHCPFQQSMTKATPENLGDAGLMKDIQNVQTYYDNIYTVITPKAKKIRNDEFKMAFKHITKRQL